MFGKESFHEIMRLLKACLNSQAFANTGTKLHNTHLANFATTGSKQGLKVNTKNEKLIIMQPQLTHNKFIYPINMFGSQDVFQIVSLVRK